jgi:hypothetical protein
LRGVKSGQITQLSINMAQSQSLMEVKWRAMICPSWQSKSKMITQSEPRRWPIEVYINQQIKKKKRGGDRERETHTERHTHRDTRREKKERRRSSTYTKHTTSLNHSRTLERRKEVDLAD